MAQSEFLRLQRIVVDGLFDIYNHDIDLNLDDRVTLLHGPNGVGKTVVLGMINARPPFCGSDSIIFREFRFCVSF